MPERKDPYRNFRFLLEIGGIIQAGFSEVTMTDTTSDPIEYREGNEVPTVRKLPGLVKYGNLTLKWGITDSSIELFKWHQLAMDGKDARRNIAVILTDEAGTPVSRWEFSEAWPTKYNPPDFNAKGNEVAIESIEITHEKAVRVL
ncbi:MAG: phage tail protein [Halobacteriota archaeon]